jgi:hypothetical protein
VPRLGDLRELLEHHLWPGDGARALRWSLARASTSFLRIRTMGSSNSGARVRGMPRSGAGPAAEVRAAGPQIVSTAVPVPGHPLDLGDVPLCGGVSRHRVSCDDAVMSAGLATVSVVFSANRAMERSETLRRSAVTCPSSLASTRAVRRVGSASDKPGSRRHATASRRPDPRPIASVGDGWIGRTTGRARCPQKAFKAGWP